MVRASPPRRTGTPLPKYRMTRLFNRLRGGTLYQTLSSIPRRPTIYRKCSKCSTLSQLQTYTGLKTRVTLKKKTLPMMWAMSLTLRAEKKKKMARTKRMSNHFRKMALTRMSITGNTVRRRRGPRSGVMILNLIWARSLTLWILIIHSYGSNHWTTLYTSKTSKSLIQLE